MLHIVEVLTLNSPGSTVGAATLEQSMAFIAECINRAHKETQHAIIVLENMVWHACVPTSLGHEYSLRFRLGQGTSLDPVSRSSVTLSDKWMTRLGSVYAWIPVSQPLFALSIMSSTYNVTSIAGHMFAAVSYFFSRHGFDAD